MKTLKLLIPVLLIAAALSCKKSSTVSPVKTNPNPVPVTIGAITGGKGVYVAGWESFYKVGADSLTNATGIPRVAKIWKDSKPYNLTDGTHDAVAYCVYANGSDVYATGFEFNKDSIQTAMLWKNGVPTVLGDGKAPSVGNGVYLSGNDVYVAGNKYDATGSSIPLLWKNGVAGILASPFGAANSIVAYNGDVYVAGESAGLLPAVWKNGVLTELKGSNTQNYAPHSIFVDKGNVYVAGQGQAIPNQPTDWYEKLDTLHIGLGYWSTWTSELSTAVAMAWLNGMPSNPTGGNQVYSVFSHNNVVLLAGDQAESELPTIWRNGLPTVLNAGVPASGANAAYAGYVIAVAQDEKGVVYGGGWRTIFQTGDYLHIHDFEVPVLWQDGVIAVLNNSDNAATLKLYPKTGGRAKFLFIVN